MVKRLAELVEGTGAEIVGNARVEITGIAYHSGKVTDGTLFVAIEGSRTSGRNYVVDAFSRGAVAVAASDISGISKPGLSLVRTENPRRFLAEVANRFYDLPCRSVKLIGITGTNGKTTASYIVKAILEAAGSRSGLVGTIRHYNGQEWVMAVNTTPESLDIIQLLAKLRELKIEYCVLEVSSHAIALDRIAGLDFAVGVFMNFSQDHLDFHGTMEDYKNVKLRFFQVLKPEVWVVYNADDPVGPEFRAAIRAKKVSFGIMAPDSENQILGPGASAAGQATPAGDLGVVRGVITSLTDKSTAFRLLVDGSETPITTTLVGRHNVYNVLAAAGVARCLGIAMPFVRQGVQQVKFVPGRMKRVENPRNLTVFVDYAHSPDALERLIRAAREILDAKRQPESEIQQRIIVVFGCGGNRDREKRPIMGRIATELADYVIITSDNPRDEDPYDIIDDIKAGIEKENYEVEPNRYAAIRKALFRATLPDIVLIAGKGHENYQILGSERKHFDDEETVRSLLGTR